MKIINCNRKYAQEITDLFHNAVHTISQKYYAIEQLEAWSQTPPNYKDWQKRLEETLPYILIKKGKAVAFIELAKDGKIDCMYTHPNYQRQGLASTLYDYIEDLACKRHEKFLYTYSSKVAKNFFLKKGFDLVHKNHMNRNNITIVNYYMVKKL